MKKHHVRIEVENWLKKNGKGNKIGGTVFTDSSAVDRKLVRRNLKFSGIHLSDKEAQSLKRHLHKVYGADVPFDITPTTRQMNHNTYYTRGSFTGMRVRCYGERKHVSRYFDKETNTPAEYIDNGQGSDIPAYKRGIQLDVLIHKRVPVEDYDKVLESMSNDQRKLFLKWNNNKNRMHNETA